jgi:hypothetical protein
MGTGAEGIGIGVFKFIAASEIPEPHQVQQGVRALLVRIRPALLDHRRAENINPSRA